MVSKVAILISVGNNKFFFLVNSKCELCDVILKLLLLTFSQKKKKKKLKIIKCLLGCHKLPQKCDPHPGPRSVPHTIILQATT